MNCFISVIIPTLNRSEFLGDVLNSLTHQFLPVENFEIIVVDNGSVDNTSNIARSFGSLLPKLRYVYEPEPGLHAARHRGLREASSDLLVYADDDIEALPSWLVSICDAFTNYDAVLVGGNNLPKFIVPPPVWLIKLWEQGHPLGGKVMPPLSILELDKPVCEFDPMYVWGCNFAIRKSVLLAAGGFHPDGMPERMIKLRGDGETHVSKFVSKTGGRCVFHPEASVYHKVSLERMTFKYFRKRGFNQGISDSYTSLRDGSVKNSSNIPAQRLTVKIRNLWRQARSILFGHAEMIKAQREYQAGYDRGFKFHQNIYRNSRDLRDWVHQEHYF